MRQLSVAIVALLALATGCGGEKDKPKKQEPATAGPAPSAGAPAPAPASPPQAREGKLVGCTFITEAEASEALGQPSKYRSNDGESANCLIDPADEKNKMSGWTVDFTVSRDMGRYDYGTKHGKSVEGVGDKAVFSLSSLVVVKGDYVVAITATSMSGDADQTLAKEKSFAEKVLGHLK